MNKAIIIVDSIYHGNTKKIAQSIGNELNCKVISLNQACNHDIAEYSIVGFGSGIYFGKHSLNLLSFIDTIQSNIQNAFILTTHGRPYLGKYNNTIKESLIKKGSTIIGEFSVRSYDNTGPWTIIGGGNIGKPNEHDCSRARKFIRKKLRDFIPKDPYLKANKKTIIENNPNTYILDINEQKIMLTGDKVTINQTICAGNKCLKCVKVCPLTVFSNKEGNVTPTRELDCIQCDLCKNNCPKKAINIHGNWKDAIKIAFRHKNRGDEIIEK